MFCFASYVQAETTDTISIKNNNLRMANLKEGSSKYLSWTKNSKSGRVSWISMSERVIYFKKINGRDVIIVVQHKFINDTSRNNFVYTVSDRNNFETLYDYTSNSKVIEAYDYHGYEVRGADTVKQNSRHNFSLKFTDLPYCFELDVETLRALPLKNVGQKMTMAFYQPGRSTSPKLYPVEVIGEEQLPTVRNEKVDCWVVKLTSDSENYDLSWISKSTHEYLKLESHDPEGIFYKVKLFNTDLPF